MIYYKIVHENTNNQLQSAINHESPYLITYTPNEWIKPINPKSKLFAFETLENAQNFIEKLELKRCSIYECKALNTSKLEHLAGTINSYDDFWNDKPVPFTIKTPPGTIVCNEIKLTKIVS